MSTVCDNQGSLEGKGLLHATTIILAIGWYVRLWGGYP
uniref:Uncharacterized protein n=1 Tax=Klebsiella pneumoniae TaxID=573 RepID=A0A8E6L5W6_KLEPN|nr:hypothetical protein [Klebsiella pneumoniae]